MFCFCNFKRAHFSFKTKMLNYPAILFGFLIEMLWILSFLHLHIHPESLTTKIIKILFEFYSLLNCFLFFNKSKTYQLFYSDASVLKQTHHAKFRTISSKRRKTLRYLIGKFLRGTANQSEGKPWTLGKVIEIDIWVMSDYLSNIFIFLNPFCVLISYICLDLIKCCICFVIINAFFFYFIREVRASNADNKIIGQELYKTQTAQMQDHLVKNIYQDYSERVITRRINYQKHGIPRYGPGTDLKPYYRNMYHNEDSSETETE